MKINVETESFSKTKVLPQRLVRAEGVREAVKGPVVTEHFLEILVNERLFARLVCTPEQLPELVLGRLFTEGLIRACEEVESITLCQQGRKARVFLKESLRLPEGPGPNESFSVEPTCCTGNRVFLKAGKSLTPLPAADYRPEWIFQLVRVFAEDSKLHRETGGTHSCYLGVAGKCVFHSEDISRHNALDKCIGYGVRMGIPMEKCILFTTGRVPADMAEKAVAAGVPVLVSKAVPTDAAVELAARYNLTLICRAWPDSYTVFHEGIKN